MGLALRPWHTVARDATQAVSHFKGCTVNIFLQNKMQVTVRCQ